MLIQVFDGHWINASQVAYITVRMIYEEMFGDTSAERYDVTICFAGGEHPLSQRYCSKKQAEEYRDNLAKDINLAFLANSEEYPPRRGPQ